MQCQHFATEYLVVDGRTQHCLLVLLITPKTVPVALQECSERFFVVVNDERLGRRIVLADKLVSDGQPFVFQRVQSFQ